MNLPVKNIDSITVAFTGAPIGLAPPYRVMATGITATVASVDR
jgi:hypothetical protein